MNHAVIPRFAWTLSFFSVFLVVQYYSALPSACPHNIHTAHEIPEDSWGIRITYHLNAHKEERYEVRGGETSKCMRHTVIVYYSFSCYVELRLYPYLCLKETLRFVKIVRQFRSVRLLTENIDHTIPWLCCSVNCFYAIFLYTEGAKKCIHILRKENLTVLPVAWWR